MNNHCPFMGKTANNFLYYCKMETDNAFLSELIYFTLTVVYLHKGVLCHPSLNPTFYFCLPVANIKVWCLKAASTMTMAMTDRSHLNDFSFILKCVKFDSF